MNNLLLTTAYFPPISYFSAITQATQVTIEQYENFGKQSYRNRCNIMAANGVLRNCISKALNRHIKIHPITSIILMTSNLFSGNGRLSFWI